MITDTHEIIFSFDNDEKVVIQLHMPLNEVDCCTEFSVVFIQKSKQLVLSRDFLHYNINMLDTLLKKVLKQELMLHSTITKDIGYLFNQESAIICGEKLKEPTFVHYIKRNNELYWPGNDYHLWANGYVAWLYNNFEGDIIFEITPFYPYMYSEPEEESNYISYEEWIKTYKPYFIREIPIKTAQEWLKQTESILQIIDSNIKLWKNPAKS